MMKLVCITEADFYAEEAKDICRLCADEHVFRVHIRKPNATKEEFYHLLNQLSTSCFEKISVHDYFEAVDDFPITGIHINSRHPVKNPHFKGLVSRSCHSLEEVCQYKNHMDYVFLSPVFDSISKQGYRAAFSMETLEQARGIIDEKVFALGGVTLDKITILEQLHFGGIAVYGKRSLQMLKEV
ncbi:MAG: thiamine phosphate synthase [Bacteroidales bacterium]|nr:thiamine phosphate synthase [Bacteroidales bacterium]